MLIYRTFLSAEIKTKCRDKKDYKRRNIVGLLQKLIKTYDVMADKYAGVWDERAACSCISCVAKRTDRDNN